MRFRLIRRGTAAHSAVPEKPAAPLPGSPLTALQNPSRPRRLSSAPQTLITPMGAITVKPAAGRIF